MSWHIDITDSAGNRYGSGPIRTAQRWEYVDRIDQAGTFTFEIPANDPQAGECQEKRYAHCYALINGAVTEVGSGIINQVTLTITDNNHILTVSGNNLMRELAWRRVGTLTIGTAGDPPTPAVTGPASIMALAPAGWTLDTVNGHNATLSAVYYEYNGETVLAALNKLAELTGEHFRLGSGRTVVWMQKDQDDSGIIARRHPPKASATPGSNEAWITGLTEEDDSYSQYSRIYPYGSGTGSAQVIIDASVTFTPPAGYTIDLVNGYIKRDAVDAVLRIDGEQPFKDVTDANTLAIAAYEWLRRHSSVYNNFTLDLVGLTQALTPGMTMRAIYRRVVDGLVILDLDVDLYLLEVTTTLDAQGLHISRVSVSTTDASAINADRYAVTDASATLDALVQATSIGQGRQFVAVEDVELPDSLDDIAAISIARGMLISAQGSTPEWAGLAVGSANQALVMGANEPGWKSLAELALTKVSTTPGVDMKTAGATTLYTVPAGKTFIPVMVMIRSNSASLAGGTEYDFTDWLQNVDLSGMTVTTGYRILHTTDNATFTGIGAGGTFQITVVTGSTAACTAVIDVFGILV